MNVEALIAILVVTTVISIRIAVTNKIAINTYMHDLKWKHIKAYIITNATITNISCIYKNIV